MRTHELARILLAHADMPLLTHANNHSTGPHDALRACLVRTTYPYNAVMVGNVTPRLGLTILEVLELPESTAAEVLTPPSDKRDGRIERLEAIAEWATKLTRSRSPGSYQIAFEELQLATGALAADDAESAR